ncbi:hypothetical protein T06_1931 [Trichinella sp. T6]|nr:hypothetical protein T06_1931 [Trichinella sp. T6]
METQIEQLRLGHAASGDLRRANDVYAVNKECAEQYRNGYISSDMKSQSDYGINVQKDDDFNTSENTMKICSNQPDFSK